MQQTAMGTPSAVSPRLSVRKQEKQPGKGYEPPQEDKAQIRGYRYHFLNTLFEPRSVTRVHPLFTKRNYDYLYQTAKNYSELLGSSLDIDRDEVNFTKLYDRLHEILPTKHHLKFIDKYNSLSFGIISGEKQFDFESIFIPVSILCKTEGKLRDILLLFFRLLRQAQGINTYSNTIYDEYYMDQIESEIIKDYEDPYSIYCHGHLMGGYCYETMELVSTYTNKTPRDLRKLIKHYTPSRGIESELIACIQKGLPLIFKDRIKNYISLDEIATQANDEDEGLSGYYLDIEEVFMFIYEFEEDWFRQILEWQGEKACEYGYEYVKETFVEISPKTKKLVQTGFPTVFMEWLIEFINLLERY